MKLTECTGSIRTHGKKALVPFFTAGFPDRDTSLRLIEAASRSGCRVIEIGVPFSDPVADGPAIQESSRRALDGGMSLRNALALAEQASKSTGAELVIMSYVNPILRMGMERFSTAARDSGVSGVIIPDVPVEESGAIRGFLNGMGIALIDLVAPTSDDGRVERITASAAGFVYLVSLTGVTGVRSAVSEGLGGFVRRVRERTDLPLYVGFGVSTPEQAVAATEHADGVIVGSALVRMIQSAKGPEDCVDQVERFLNEMNGTINRPKRR